jgi:Zn-dependent alcohol dehydrogenase
LNTPTREIEPFRIDMPKRLDLYRQDRLRLDEFVTSRIKLDEVNT